MRSRLELAMGGLARIRSVGTFTREVLRRETAPGGPDRVTRVLVHRAAGGRVRADLWVLRAGCWEAADFGRPSGMTVAPALDRPSGNPAEISDVLRLARLEPRNVIAHLDDLPHAIRTGRAAEPDPAAHIRPAIDVELTEEGMLYRFDPITDLCQERVDLSMKSRTSYEDWRIVDGIPTPFLEVQETGGLVVEDRVLGIAYDLPFPPGLFQTS